MAISTETGKIYDMLNKQAATVTKIINGIIKALLWIAGVCLSLMVLAVVVNVFGRSLFHSPLLGTVEIVELLNLVVISFVLAYTESKYGHIVVEIVSSRFSRHAQAILASIMCLIGAAFFVVTAWQAVRLMWQNIFPRVLVTHIFSVPVAPFLFVIAFGTLILGLEMFAHFFSPLPQDTVERGEIE